MYEPESFGAQSAGSLGSAKLQAALYAQQQVAGSIGKDAPLTAILKDSSESSLSTARRTHSILLSLRDRMFGSPPEVANPATPVPQPFCFADAMREVNSDLSSVLLAIERLSTEIADRL
jgi:hypothetical protein